MTIKFNRNLKVAGGQKDRTIPTAGETFEDGSGIDLVRFSAESSPQLMLWNGQTETIGPVVNHGGYWYEPAEIQASILQELTLPTRCSEHKSTREFLTEICALVTNFTGIPKNASALLGRVALCSALVDALPVMPNVVIGGPDTARANQLLALLRCLCRHSLRLTGVTPAGFCSLGGKLRFSYLISQSTISPKLKKLLDDASCSDRKIPMRGGLIDLFGLQVINSDSALVSQSSPARSIHISLTPTGQPLPAIDPETQRRITAEFQAKLLSFRRANLGLARDMQFDLSKFSLPLRDLARSLMAATPDDITLQAEVYDLLQEHEAEIRTSRWTEFDTAALESILVVGHESPGRTIYVAELAAISEEILRRRGEVTLEVPPTVLGKRLKVLGFSTAVRDAQGVKLTVTNSIINLAKELLENLGGAPFGGFDKDEDDDEEGKEVG
jgi:hypothetical protein